MTEKLAYSIDEAAEALSISRSATKEMLYTGKIKCVSVGRRKLIPKWALDAFLSGADNPEAEPTADWNQVLKSI